MSLVTGSPIVWTSVDFFPLSTHCRKGGIRRKNGAGSTFSKTHKDFVLKSKTVLPTSKSYLPRDPRSLTSLKNQRNLNYWGKKK